MIWSASALKGLSIAATDGEIGTVSDCLFDDATWRLRYLVVDTGTWLPGRLVLLHPSVLGVPHDRSLPVSLTRAKVEASPDIQQDLPVSQQMEQRVSAYYGWNPGWGGGAFGMESLVVPLAPPETAELDATGDPHLRSVSATIGQHIQATDGTIGHASDVLISDGDWTLRYLVIDTRNWWPGQHVLLSPQTIAAIDWLDQKIDVRVTQAQVQSSPKWDPAATLDEAYEQQLRSHYDWRAPPG